MARLTIRLDFDSGASLGPGKIRLLEEIERTRSIRGAAKAVNMSFRQAWLLLKAIEDTFGQPVIATARGGVGGGGATLTDLGKLAVASYRTLEQAANAAARREIAFLEGKIPAGALNQSPRRKRLPRKSRNPK
jgi:molybdate transport system regulatory protein